MTNLLLVTKFPDEHLHHPDYVFVYHQATWLKCYFDEVFVIAAQPYVPRLFSPLRRVWPTVGACLDKRDYTRENMRVLFPRYSPRANFLSREKRCKIVHPSILGAIDRENLRFDLIHAHMTLNGWYGVQLGKQFGVPTVLTCHENHDWLMGQIRNPSPVHLEAWRESDLIIRVNPFDIPDLATVAGPEKRIISIPNGFDERLVPQESREAVRNTFNLPRDRPILVSVARWVPRKDPLILIKAVRQVIDSGRQPAPLLLLIGEDKMEGRIQQKIAEARVGDHVRLLGKKTPRDVLRYMRAADLVVLYSHSEGNPTVMFEALGCGRPYIGSDVGGARSIITDERLGRLGPPKDVEALVGLLRRALDTTWDEQYIMVYARRYAWANIARRIYEEAYLPLLDGRPPK